MVYTSVPNHFETIPADIQAMPARVEAAEATSTELRQLYEAWSTFHNEINGGTHQLPNHVHVDTSVSGAVWMRPEIDNQRDSILVWRLVNQRDPAINIRYIQYTQEENKGYTKLDHAILVRASGEATYKLTRVEQPLGIMMPSAVEHIFAPSFNDVLLFYDALRQVTAPDSVEPKKQRLANRLIGWLFNRPA